LSSVEANGPDEALSVVWESVRGEDLAGRLAVVRESEHPAAGETGVVTGFTASGMPRSIDQVVQLKVTLKRGKPAIWRSVRLPVIATLGDLHQVIQILFGWDGDHLHAFRVGRRTHSAPFFALEDAADKDGIRVRDACRLGVKVGLRVRLRSELAARDHGCRRPSRSTRTSRIQPSWLPGRLPVEYPSEENPQEPEPFNLTEVNRKLAKPGR
jgi:hypothetical protein